MSHCLSTTVTAVKPSNNNNKKMPTYLLNRCPPFWCCLDKIPTVSCLAISTFCQTQAFFDTSFSRYHSFVSHNCVVYPHRIDLSRRVTFFSLLVALWM